MTTEHEKCRFEDFFSEAIRVDRLKRKDAIGASRCLLFVEIRPHMHMICAYGPTR